MENLRNIEFPVIEYDSETYEASESGEMLSTGSVVCNEFQGTSTVSKNKTSCFNDMSDWMFEALLKFDKEVDIDNLFFNTFDLNFVSEQGILVKVESNNFYVQHPTRKGTPTGTECRLTFKVTTRR